MNLDVFLALCANHDGAATQLVEELAKSPRDLGVLLTFIEMHHVYLLGKRDEALANMQKRQIERDARGQSNWQKFSDAVEAHRRLLLTDLNVLASEQVLCSNLGLASLQRALGDDGSGFAYYQQEYATATVQALAMEYPIALLKAVKQLLA